MFFWIDLQNSKKSTRSTGRPSHGPQNDVFSFPSMPSKRDVKL
jgi:hypothetical protein